ncbi:glutaredoxin family protein [Natronospira bacteriovora]|uniref:Glutaredoxin family protein n=1 Tax=Natronospira bacteriovora TaxID=3069753 RepID=A0ABU0W4A1_9GAMM|nr:glutaredoxin family protein [Natronospira sp. AB-CW4]MDQ2068290.1 glutaredoxin family protein [Natronospira sp. AB-CW4]
MSTGDSGTAPTLTLYGRPNCGLCDTMLEAIHARYGQALIIEKIDISGDPQLERRYGLKIPVLALGEEVICYGHLDSERLAQTLSRQAQ